MRRIRAVMPRLLSSWVLGRVCRADAEAAAGPQMFDDIGLLACRAPIGHAYLLGPKTRGRKG